MKKGLCHCTIYLSIPSSLVIIGPLANVNKNWQKDRSLKQITCLWQIDTRSKERESQIRALAEQLFSKRQQPACWSADMNPSMFRNSNDMSNCLSCPKHWEVWRRWRRAVPPYNTRVPARWNKEAARQKDADLLENKLHSFDLKWEPYYFISHWVLKRLDLTDFFLFFK